MFDAWQFPTLAWGGPTLPSALRRFTSEFGMGSGGTTALLPPGKFFVPETNLPRCCCVGRIRITQSHTAVCSFLMSHLPPCFSATSFVSADFFYPVNNAENRLSSPKRLWRCKVKPHGSLVPVSSTHRCAYTPGLSTSSSSTSLQETQGLREDSSRGKFRA